MDGGSLYCTGGCDQNQPKEKKCKKAKWLSEEALQIAVKRREVKNTSLVKNTKEKWKDIPI